MRRCASAKKKSFNRDHIVLAGVGKRKQKINTLADVHLLLVFLFRNRSDQVAYPVVAVAGKKVDHRNLDHGVCSVSQTH